MVNKILLGTIASLLPPIDANVPFSIRSLMSVPKSKRMTLKLMLTISDSQIQFDVVVCMI